MRTRVTRGVNVRFGTETEVASRPQADAANPSGHLHQSPLPSRPHAWEKRSSATWPEGSDMMILALSAIGLVVFGLCYCIEVANQARLESPQHK